MEETEKYFYFKYYVYLRVGRPVAAITHNVNRSLSYVKELVTAEARKKYGENFHYLDIWTMDERFLEIVEYKREKGLE